MTFNPAGAGTATPLALYPFAQGRLGTPTMPKINGWEGATSRLIGIDWHPAEPILAMIDELQNTVRFARVSEALELAPIGNVVAIERAPYRVELTPDGRWIVTTNLERSYLPYEDPRITWFSSLTLLEMDQETGNIDVVDTFSYDGILPEAAVFDNTGQYLAIATYDHFDDRKRGGSIDFWCLQSDPLDPTNIQLVKTEHSVPVTRGAHSLVIAR